MLATLIVGGFTIAANAESESDATPGGYNIKGAVQGPPPARPGTITSPAADKHFSSTSIMVDGGCPAGTLVKIFKNQVMAGATFCAERGLFSLPIDLFYGSNNLTVGVYNTLNVGGPESAVTTVYRDAPAAVGSGSKVDQLVVKSENTYKGVETGEQLSWPIEIIGGVPPYALAVKWGDGVTDVLSRTDPGALTLDHVYDKAGGGIHSSYQITDTVSDAAGNQTNIHLTTIVGDSFVTISPITLTDTSGLVFAWPLLAIVTLMVISFDLGEWREKLLIQKRESTEIKT
jgi:hypothetical protein